MPFKYDFTRLKTRDQLISFLQLNEKSFKGVLAFDPNAPNLSAIADEDITKIGAIFLLDMKFQRKITNVDIERFGSQFF